MNRAPKSGLAVIENGGSNMFVLQGNHTIRASFSITNVARYRYN